MTMFGFILELSKHQNPLVLYEWLI